LDHTSKELSIEQNVICLRPQADDRSSIVENLLEINERIEIPKVYT
jgi:hypothetical protein